MMPAPSAKTVAILAADYGAREVSSNNMASLDATELTLLWREQLVRSASASAPAAAPALPVATPPTKFHANYPRPPPRPAGHQLARDATGAVLAFFTMTVLNMVFAGAVFSTDALRAALGPGLRAATASTVAAGLLSLGAGRLPWVCAGPDLAYTPFLALVAARVADGVVVVTSSGGYAVEALDASSQRATFGVLCVLAMGGVGAGLGLSGRRRMLRLAEFLPLPSICGLLSGIGCLVLRLCVDLSAGGATPAARVAHFLPTLILGLFIFAVFKKGRHPAIVLPPLALGAGGLDRGRTRDLPFPTPLRRASRIRPDARKCRHTTFDGLPSRAQASTPRWPRR